MDTPTETWGSTTTPSSRPASQKSGRSSRSARSAASSRTTEETPLLAREDGEDRTEDEEAQETPARTSLLRSLLGSSGSKSRSSRRWPSIVALLVLIVAFALILFGFLASEGVEDYAMQAADFKPTRLALESLTEKGVRVQIEGDFTMDASKVEKKSVRNIGRFGTWIAREVESGPTDIDVYVPEYGNVLVGKAKLPSIKVNVRNGHTTHISVRTDLQPGSFEGLRNIANDYLDGRLASLRLQGKAEVPLKSGLLRLGKQTVEQSVVFEDENIPALPKYNIGRLNLREARDGYKGVGADVSIDVTNDYPLDLAVPPVAVEVLVDGCMPADPYIGVGYAETERIHVQPKTDLHVNVTGHVQKLPDALTAMCPDSLKSPLDTFIGNYMHGEDSTVYVKCCNFPDPETPQWPRDLLKDITVPVPFAGRTMGDLIKNFTLDDVHFHLPDLLADPGTPEAQPKISAVVKVLVGLPNEMNFPLHVDQVRAKADVYYHKKKLGILHLEKWQEANSTRIDAHDDEGASLLVESGINKAPLEITDDDLFSEIVQSLIFGDKPIYLTIKAAVDVGINTPIGEFAVREIPAEGVVPVKPIRSGDGKGIGSLHPKIGNLAIVDTSPTSLFLQALVNFTNPTKYSATVPYFNINVLVNGTVVGQVTVEDATVVPGNNTNLVAKIVWDPATLSGNDGDQVGKEWLSQYISGYNTTLTVQTHNGSVPSQPALGTALSAFPVDFPTPHLRAPKDPSDGGEDRPHFIQSATVHLISSTAVFTLSSPFATTTLYITHLNATAFYDGQPSAKILYDLPFAVPPGLSVSPRLPVDWSLGSVGYEAIKKALGGTLKLKAFAHVGVRIGQWNQRIWFQGGSIGANVRL